MVFNPKHIFIYGLVLGHIALDALAMPVVTKPALASSTRKKLREYPRPAKLSMDPGIVALRSMLPATCRGKQQRKNSLVASPGGVNVGTPQRKNSLKTTRRRATARGISDSIEVPSNCPFEMPPNNKLILHKKEGAATEGILLPKKYEGTKGVVFQVQGHWSTSATTPAGAKWWKDVGEGLAELVNLRDVQELVDYGVTVSESPTLWGIIKWKQGQILSALPSYKAMKAAKNLAKCKIYMAKYRAAVLAADQHYIRLPGAPHQGDMHPKNVLVVEQGTGDAVQLIASMIDFGVVHWFLETNDPPTPEQFAAFSEEVKATLAEQSDFSDDGNCAGFT